MKTFKELKEFVNSLNKDQLNEPVRWLAEDEKRGLVLSAEVLKEQYQDSDGFELSKGTPIIKVDC